MEGVVLHRVGFLAYFCPKQVQDIKPSTAPLYPNMGQVPPGRGTRSQLSIRGSIKCGFTLTSRLLSQPCVLYYSLRGRSRIFLRRGCTSKE